MGDTNEFELGIGETLDYTFDFNGDDPLLVTGETIASVTSVTVTPATGLTKNATVAGTTTVIQWFTGVTAAWYTADCKIVTTDGRTYSRYIKINVVTRR